MKIVILSLILILGSLKTTYAIDQVGLDQLKQQGFQVRMGELTGAGGKMSLARLAGFIHPLGIVMKDDCKNIVITKTGQANPQISDITKVTVDQSVIPASEFVGFFTFQ